MGPRAFLCFRQTISFLSQRNALHKESHVSRKISHCSEPLAILLNLFREITVNLVILKGNMMLTAGI